jgi:hypothetical protein
VTSGAVKSGPSTSQSGEVARPPTRQASNEDQHDGPGYAAASGAAGNSSTATEKSAFAAEKTTNSGVNGELNSVIGEPEITANETVVPRELIPFEAGRESDILAQVLLLLSDMVKSNAKNVSSAAISGPNTLVLKFPKSYSFSKQFFDRSPDQLKRVEQAIEQVVGRRIQASLAVDESIAQVRESKPVTRVQESRPEAETAAETASDAERDPLVQRAISVFGARVVRKDRGAAPPVE